TGVDVTADVSAFFLPGGHRAPIEPARCADTRVGAEFTTVDGLFLGDGAVGPDGTYPVRVAGRCGVPADAVAVFANVTAVGPAADGYLTVYPCGVDRPTASNVNYLAGDTVPNAVLATIAPADGTICVYSSAAADVIVDITGFVPAENPDFTMVEA